MIENVLPIGQLSVVLQQISQEVEKLTAHGQTDKPPTISSEKLDSFINTLKKFNSAVDVGYWDDKKLAVEGMNESLEKALQSVHLIHSNLTNKSHLSQKNVDQLIVSLFGSLGQELKELGNRLQNLKKYRLGQKVEKSNQSKEY